jgi:hypothetical protein
MTQSPHQITSTELVWPGKRTQVERVVLPLQTVETVNKPRVDQPRFDFGEWPENYPRDWRNKLIWGDNKYVMASLLRDFAGQINLIYIAPPLCKQRSHPPFATGADFTVEVKDNEQVDLQDLSWELIKPLICGRPLRGRER